MKPKVKKALAIGIPIAVFGVALMAMPGKASAAEVDDDDDDDDAEADDSGGFRIDELPPLVPPPQVDVIVDDGDTPLELPDLPPIVVDLPPKAPAAKAPLPPLPEVPQPPLAPAPSLDELTANMVTDLLSAERTPGWKRTYASVGAWQAARGLTADRKFGPGSATRLALESGLIPIVRYWPLAAGANPQAALDDYRSGLLTIASRVGGQHSKQLQASAAREQGQSFGPPTGDGGKFAVAGFQ